MPYGEILRQELLKDVHLTRYTANLVAIIVVMKWMVTERCTSNTIHSQSSSNHRSNEVDDQKMPNQELAINGDNNICTFRFCLQPQLVPMAGYPLETYKLTSSDGYILTVFRLPNMNYPHSNGYSVFVQHGILSKIYMNYPHSNGYSVFVQHGILSNGANFVTLGNVSLVYLLWDAGYDVWFTIRSTDVWVGNFRGTYYSQDHINLTVYDKEYWDHSIDEMATIDMPLIMDFISKTTARRGNIYYIGHSLGTTIALMYAAAYPEESAQHVRMFVFMAPAYTLSNMISPYKQIVPLVPLVWKIATDFDLYRLLGQSQPLRAITQIFCLESPILIQLCAQLHNLFYGPTTGVGSEKVPVYYNIVPGGTALKVLAQAADLVANHFRKFDYGVKNLEKYGTVKPPPYDISKIKAPCYIMYGMNDWVAGKKDAINLYNTLSPEARYGIREINDGDFNHLDFIYGRHAKQYVYDRIINLFDTFPNKTYNNTYTNASLLSFRKEFILR
ncbi:alpha/beta-hydrolase lipase region [Popillia japonica]|uniref:Alpha/beta-hydrolase lipase region n=1 Tax=Popillia japonica TaxID=7064 RepID=A0AAW1LQA0_POPJA